MDDESKFPMLIRFDNGDTAVIVSTEDIPSGRSFTVLATKCPSNSD